ncbi:MAG: TonB-dependent receptor [Microscillaceae bacterium]|nr:TonB-dependent receptor [Microscillaceae bacterium]
MQSEYLFAQFEWFIGQKWNILLGFRYDHHHQYQSQLSPKLGLTYEVQPHLFLKASLGYGYKAPDLRQLYLDFTNSAVGYSVFGYNVAPARMDALEAQGQLLFRNALDFSAPLRPESSLNLNLGGSMEKNRLSLDVNFFYNQIQNLIDTRAVAQRTNGQNVFSYFNLNRILTYGLEVNAQYRASKHWTFSAGYQFLEAQDRDVLSRLEEGQVFARDPNTLSSFRLQRQDYFGLFNRSRQLANFKINFEVPKWKTNLAIRLFYRSRYGLFDSNQNQILDEYDEFVKGYCLLNMTLSQEFKYGFSAQIGLNNLLDFTDPVNISNIPGRQWLLKVAYSF